MGTTFFCCIFFFWSISRNSAPFFFSRNTDEFDFDFLLRYRSIAFDGSSLCVWRIGRRKNWLQWPITVNPIVVSTKFIFQNRFWFDSSLLNRVKGGILPCFFNVKKISLRFKYFLNIQSMKMKKKKGKKKDHTRDQWMQLPGQKCNVFADWMLAASLPPFADQSQLSSLSDEKKTLIEMQRNCKRNAGWLALWFFCITLENQHADGWIQHIHNTNTQKNEWKNDRNRERKSKQPDRFVRKAYKHI